ncbi:MAG: glycosyltransferase family 2 protein [Clostridia bacterium]|nr:glycosyltransferase family 2 protein [Clostridia bacterium]
MEKYTVSGCIVTHNNMRTIKDTLDSVLKHTKALSFKLFVVDNLSTDGTPDFIRENYPQVELIEPGTNKGFGSGHNEVLDKINSKYHAIINPDIVIDNDVIKVMADKLDEDESVGMLSPKILFPDGRLQILGKRMPKLKYLIASRMRSGDEPSDLLAEYAMLDRDPDEEYPVEIATGCFMFIRTDLFKKIGGFDDRYFLYFEDFDLACAVNKVSKVLYYPKAFIYHVWGRESKKNFKLKFVQIKSMIKFYLKWMIGKK